jgi:hypothetical protein
MAEYKGIHGTKVQNYTSDPTNPILGQVWYNETSQTMKVQAVTTTGSWATGTSINTARMTAPGTGSYTDMMIAGGISGPPLYNTFTNTELWNGSAWTETNDISTARYGTGVAGTTTAALIYGGNEYPPYTNEVESWNGTSWTAGTSINTTRGMMSSAGQVYTDCMGFGGFTPGGPTGATEIWNGASWTEVNDLNTTSSRYHAGGTGADTTAALCFGGGPTYQTSSESWNGTCWTATSAMNAPSGLLQTIGNTYTDCLGAGGGQEDPAIVAKTEQWNGTAWTEVADLPTATRQQSYGNNGTTGSGLSVGGQQPGVTGPIDTVYDWIGAGSPTTRTITSS